MLQLYRYTLFILLGGLLAACTQESRRATARRETAAARAADAQPAMPPAPEPTPPTVRPVLGRAAVAYSSRRVRRRAARRQLPAAVALDSTTRAPAEPAAAAISNDLLKPAESFWVQPGRDTVLRCAEGTVLVLPADAFVTDTTAAARLTEPVELRVREFYSLPDILLQNLTTTSDGGLLETGGMVQLEARTASGRACVVRPGTDILIQMAPAAPPRRPGMQLYTGIHPAGRRHITWRSPRRALRRTDFNGRGVIFPGPAGALRRRLLTTIPYSWDMYAQLRRGPRSAEHRQKLREVGGGWLRPQLLAYARLDIDVNLDGTVRAVHVDVVGDSAGVLASGLEHAARQLPRFRPAYLQGPIQRVWSTQSSRVRREVPRKRRGRAAGIPRFPVVGSIDALVSYRRNGRVKVECTNQGYTGLSISNGLMTYNTGRMRRSLALVPTSKAPADSLSGTMFATSTLGWLNCDQPLPSDKPAVLFTVLAGDANVRSFVVLRNWRAVVGGLPSSADRHLFAGVPDTEPATIVAMKWENGRAYLATQPTTLGATTSGALDFRPMKSAAELRAALAQLER